MKRRVIAYFLLCLLFVCQGVAQELNCKVQINSSQIQGTEKQVFSTLETAISEYINDRQWTSAQMAVNERIECSIVITIKEANDNRYKGDIQLQVKRPVFNASYTTTTFNFKDNSFEFDYQEFEPLVYNENTIQSNLTAMINYYVYIILGIDFDSFSPEGGTPFFQRAEQIVNLSQSSSEPGWKAFDNTRNRHALVSAFTDSRTAPFRQLWYQYHRLGLDEMALSAEKGRSKITAALNTLKEVHSSSPTTILLPLFSDAKLEELVKVYSKAPKTEKEDVYKLLINLYPTEDTRLQEIRKEVR